MSLPATPPTATWVWWMRRIKRAPLRLDPPRPFLYPPVSWPDCKYEQGRFCDTIVRCAVLPDPARQEQEQEQQQKHREGDGADDTGSKEGSAATPPRPMLPQVHKTDISCHAVFLCARSPYFESCLGGEWNEAQTKTVEISLENNQAVHDMKLLLELCYGGSYIYDGEELLDASTRIRPVFLGKCV